MRIVHEVLGVHGVLRFQGNILGRFEGACGVFGSLGVLGVIGAGGMGMAQLALVAACSYNE